MIKRGLTLAVCVLVGACGPDAESADRIDELEGEVAALEEKLSSVRSAVEDVRSQFDDATAKANDLEGEMSRFDDDNWREVVPDVESSASDVQQAHLELDSSIDELEAAVN